MKLFLVSAAVVAVLASGAAAQWQQGGPRLLACERFGPGIYSIRDFEGFVFTGDDGGGPGRRLTGHHEELEFVVQATVDVSQLPGGGEMPYRRLREGVVEPISRCHGLAYSPEMDALVVLYSVGDDMERFGRSVRFLGRLNADTGLITDSIMAPIGAAGVSYGGVANKLYIVTGDQPPLPSVLYNIDVRTGELGVHCWVGTEGPGHSIGHGLSYARGGLLYTGINPSDDFDQYMRHLIDAANLPPAVHPDLVDSPADVPQCPVARELEWVTPVNCPALILVDSPVEGELVGADRCNRVLKVREPGFGFEFNEMLDQTVGFRGVTWEWLPEASSCADTLHGVFYHELLEMMVTTQPCAGCDPVDTHDGMQLYPLRGPAAAYERRPECAQLGSDDGHSDDGYSDDGSVSDTGHDPPLP